MDNYSHLVRSFCVSIFGVAFIGLASICVVELASRISAKGFVLSKITRLQGEISAEPENGLRAAKIEELRTLVDIADGIDHLTVSGAEKTRETIHAIRQNMMEVRQPEAVRSRLDQSRTRLNQQETRLPSLETQLTEVTLGIRDMNDRLAYFFRGIPVQQANSLPTVETKSQDVGPLKAQLAQLLVRESSLVDEIADTRRAIARLTDDIFEMENGQLPTRGSWLVQYNPAIYLPNDILLACAIILCGGIGAIFAASRSRADRYARVIFNGLLAGFITFLVIKGGRNFFVIHLQYASNSQINPYTAAFAGILAGLFTEKAYMVLQQAIDIFGERLLQAERKRQNTAGKPEEIATPVQGTA